MTETRTPPPVTPDVASPLPALLHEDLMVAEQLAYEHARRDEHNTLIREARWFAVAFVISVCLCFLIYAVL